MDELDVITQPESASGLRNARAERDKHMDISVRAAIASIAQEGMTPSFYNVAQRAQIARSTLYRKQALRALVESARDQANGAKRSRIDPYAKLLEENARLRHEVSQLREEVERLSRASYNPAHRGSTRRRVEYAFVEFPFAA